MSEYEFRSPFELLVSTTDEYTKLVPEFENSVLPELANMERLLDVGAGPGLVATPLSAHFDHTTIVEPDPTYCLETVGNILAKGKLATAFNGSWEEAELGQRQYDLLVCSHVLYFVESENWDTFLQKMVPHIRPGGRMAIVLTAKGDVVSETIQNALDIQEVGSYPFSAGVIDFAQRHGYPYQVFSLEANIRAESAEKLQDVLVLFPVMAYDNGSTKAQRLDLIEEHFKDEGQYRLPYTVDIVTIEAPA
jgi:trans-aconitate methyltransferase